MYIKQHMSNDDKPQGTNKKYGQFCSSIYNKLIFWRKLKHKYLYNQNQPSCSTEH